MFMDHEMNDHEMQNHYRIAEEVKGADKQHMEYQGL